MCDVWVCNAESVGGVGIVYSCSAHRVRDQCSKVCNISIKTEVDRSPVNSAKPDCYCGDAV